jgi:hypothetical protein
MFKRKPGGVERKGENSRATPSEVTRHEILVK